MDLTRIVALFPKVRHLDTLHEATEAVAELYAREAADAQRGYASDIRHDGTGSLDRLLRALEDAWAAYQAVSPRTAGRLDRLGFRYERAGLAVLPWAREAAVRDLRDASERAQPLAAVPIKAPLPTSRLGMMLADLRAFVSNVYAPYEPDTTAERRACLRLAWVWRDQTDIEPDEHNESFLQYCRAVLWPVQDRLSMKRSPIADVVGGATWTLPAQDDPWSDAFKRLPTPFDNPSIAYLHQSLPDDNGDWSALRMVELRDAPYLTYVETPIGNVYPPYSAVCEEIVGNVRTGDIRNRSVMRYLDEDGWPIEGKVYFVPRDPPHN